MQGQKKIYEVLENLNIKFDYYEHPAAHTIETAKKYWKDIDATHCKNLFFRNHKGNKHYLVVFEHSNNLHIKNLEKMLGQGKISFASDWRLDKYLGVKAGSVSPLSLVNNTDKHIEVFFDKNIQSSTKISFHPGVNTVSLVIQYDAFIRFLNYTKNKYRFIQLCDE